MAEIVGEICHQTGLLVYVETAHGPFAGGHLGKFASRHVDAEHVLGAFEFSLKTKILAAGPPVERGGDQVDLFGDQLRRRAARRGRDIDLRKLPPHGLAGKGDLAAIGRPARLCIFKLVIGNLRQSAAFGRNYPDVFIVALVVLLAGAVGYEGDARRIGRPLRIGIVPVFAGCDLLGGARRGIRHPQVAAFVVVPARVVELIGDVRIVPHVALALRRGDVVARSGAAQHHESGRIRRPLEGIHAVLQTRSHLRFPAIQAEYPDLRLCGCGAFGVSRREEGQAGPIGTPSGRVGIEAFGAQPPRSGIPVRGHRPDRRATPVRLLVDRGQDVGYLLAVRRNMSIARKLKCEIVFRGDASLRGARGHDRERQRRSQKHTASLHEFSPSGTRNPQVPHVSQCIGVALRVSTSVRSRAHTCTPEKLVG